MAEAAGGLLGTLYIRFTAQTDDLNKKVDESEKKVTKSADHMTHSVEGLKHVLEALGLAWGIHEVFDFAKETIHAADELKKLSQELGIAIDQLAGLKFAADKANVGDIFELGMRKFAQSFREAQVQGSEMQHFFQDMGVDVGQGFSKAFDMAAEKIKNTDDATTRLGITQEFFGTRNAKFVNLFSAGVDGIKKDVAELARVTGMSYDEAAKKSEEFNDATVMLKYSLRGIAMTVLNELLPPVTEFISWVAETAMPAVRDFLKEVGQGFKESGGMEVWAEFKQLLSDTWDILKIGLGFFGQLFSALTGTSSVAKGVGVVLTTILGTTRDLVKYALAGIKVVGIGLVGLLEGLMKIGRWIAEKLVIAFEFWANAGIKAINFLIAGFNKMTDAIPDWLKDRLGIGSGPAIKPIELFHLGKPTGIDDWIGILEDARKDLTKSLSDDFTETAKTVTEGTKKVVESVESSKKEIGNSLSPELSKKMHSELDKLVGTDDLAGGRDFRKTLGGLGDFSSGGKMFHTAGTEDMSGMSEAAKLLQEKDSIDETLKDIQKIRESHIDISAEQQKRLTALEEAEGRKRNTIALQMARVQLQTASTMFGDIADITKAWAGEQSGVYKAMFAISKAFAIADATVKIAQGIAAAAANPWPLNLFAMASVIAATASIVSSIQSVQLEFGGQRALGGPVDTGKAFLVGERGPEMFVPSRNGTIVPNNRLGGGMQPKIIVNNFSDARPEVSTRDEGTEPVIEVLVRKVEDRMGSNVRSGTGSLNKAMQDSFNLRRGQGNS